MALSSAIENDGPTSRTVPYPSPPNPSPGRVANANAALICAWSSTPSQTKSHWAFTSAGSAFDATRTVPRRGVVKIPPPPPPATLTTPGVTSTCTTMSAPATVDPTWSTSTVRYPPAGIDVTECPVAFPDVVDAAGMVGRFACVP